MTTDPDDHLDDEALSAALDGEALGVTAHSHLAGCERCQARSAALGRAMALVGTPPPPPADADREEALAAAIAAGPDAVAGTPRPQTDLVPLARARHRRRPPAWLLPAAAAVGLLAAVVALLPSGSDDTVSESVTADGDEAATESEDGAASAPQGSSEILDAPPPPPDLGVVDDGPTLRQRLARAPAVDQDERAAAAERDARCEPEVRAARPELGERGTVATLIWQGVPAVVATYPSAGGESLALVTATADCRLLAEVPVRP